jgi:hypothetical protein
LGEGLLLVPLQAPYCCWQPFARLQWAAEVPQMLAPLQHQPVRQQAPLPPLPHVPSKLKKQLGLLSTPVQLPKPTWSTAAGTANIHS